MITYRQNAKKEWVACGPVAEMKIGTVQVSKRDGSTESRQITGLGNPFSTDRGQMVYGYLAPKSTLMRKSREPAYDSACSDCRRLGRACKQCRFDEYDC